MKPVMTILFLAIAGAKGQAQDHALGTSLEWETSIESASEVARKDDRLVLALHVSGHFDRPEFT